jgi:hypothetical protein
MATARRFAPFRPRQARCSLRRLRRARWRARDMASAVRNERGYWLARWKDATGRWRKRRATPNTKRTAQTPAEELELPAPPPAGPPRTTCMKTLVRQPAPDSSSTCSPMFKAAAFSVRIGRGSRATLERAASRARNRLRGRFFARKTALQFAPKYAREHARGSGVFPGRFRGGIRGHFEHASSGVSRPCALAHPILRAPVGAPPNFPLTPSQPHD